MSVARGQRILKSISISVERQRRATVVTAGTLAAGLLTLGLSVGALVGVAFVLALLLGVCVAALVVRLRTVERAHVTLALTMSELTARVDRLQAESNVNAASATPVDAPEAAPATAAEVQPVGPTDPGANTAAAVTALSVNPDVIAVVQPRTGGRDDEALIRLTVTSSDAPGELGHSRHDRRGDADPARADDSGVNLALPETGPEPGSPSLPSISGAGHPTEGDVVAAEPVAGSTMVGPIPDGDAEGAPGVTDEETAAVAAVIPAELPPFALVSLRGETVSTDDLVSRPAVIVFWRPGCPHCQRLTPELVAWESLQGPRLVVVAACDGPTAFRAGLPGTVLLDPDFAVGQALGAPGTPAALAIDAVGRPSGPVVAGASAVTTLLLDAMRDWAASESSLEVGANTSAGAETTGDETFERAVLATVGAPPSVMLRRVDAIRPSGDETSPDWEAESVSRRTG